MCKPVSAVRIERNKSGKKGVNAVIVNDDWAQQGWNKLAYIPPSFLPCYETGIAIHSTGEIAYVGEFGKRLLRISVDW